MNINHLPLNTFPDFYTIKKRIFDPAGFHINEFYIENESKEYNACAFKLNNSGIIFRTSKITPLKIGQFVTIWKRDTDGITAPYETLDEIDFLIIVSQKTNYFGMFIFPKSVLADKGILHTSKSTGKRGMRIYPPWDNPISKQAQKTQQWQTKYFITLTGSVTDLKMVRELLTDNKF